MITVYSSAAKALILRWVLCGWSRIKSVFRRTVVTFIRLHGSAGLSEPLLGAQSGLSEMLCPTLTEIVTQHYENMPIQIYWKKLSPKNEKFQIKSSDIFQISAQNIDCAYSLEPPRRGGSNEYPHSMFLSRNKKENVYPCKPQFYYIKVGFKGVKMI